MTNLVGVRHYHGTDKNQSLSSKGEICILIHPTLLIHYFLTGVDIYSLKRKREF